MRLSSFLLFFFPKYYQTFGPVNYNSCVPLNFTYGSFYQGLRCWFFIGFEARPSLGCSIIFSTSLIFLKDSLSSFIVKLLSTTFFSFIQLFLVHCICSANNIDEFWFMGQWILHKLCLNSINMCFIC